MLGRRALAVAAAVTFLYALSDEYHQSFVEGRDADPLDVLTDAAGIAFAIGVMAAARSRPAGRNRRTARRARVPPP